MDLITSEKNKLGFVGVGYMGRRIAQRLLESGFKLTAARRRSSFDMAAQPRKALRNFPPVATSCCRAFRAMKPF
jgi:3-hydroxyisobutyrate dehydrogenase-like beta-hydroxyacid dehydrogenase